MKTNLDNFTYYIKKYKEYYQTPYGSIVVNPYPLKFTRAYSCGFFSFKKGYCTNKFTLVKDFMVMTSCMKINSR